MGVSSKLANGIEEVDVIIAGGGTAACIIAARLSEADPDLSILMIERGPNNYNVANVIHPLLYLSHLLPTSKTAIFLKGKKSPQLADREPIVPVGGTLGGGSSINFMMYTRAQRADFDSWETPGWTADEMWPTLNKLETYHGPGDRAHHGDSGPIHVSDGTYRATVSENDFIQAFEKVGWPEIRDLNNLENNNGVQRWLRYIDKEGKRQDTAHTYLHPKLQDGKHPNLQVVVESLVKRVLFDKNNRAVGVEYQPNPEFQARVNLSHSPVQTVKAKKMVIVSCGAGGSPAVLERSGVGDPEIIERAGVALVADVPGVGRDYQDHHLIIYPYKTSLPRSETFDDFLAGRANVEAMIQQKDKLLGWNAIDVSSKVRPTEAEAYALGSEFKKAWDRDFRDEPNRPLILMGLINCFLGDHAAVPDAPYFSIANYTAYPYSRGHLHITGPEVDDPLDFDPGFLSDEHDLDLKKQVWAYKKMREVARRMQIFRGELALGHPKFPPGSKASLIETGPLEVQRDIEYTPEDDAAIEQFVRENVNTCWHSLGTCKMAPWEKKGVVDANLNVYGVTGLKVADVSIPPKNVGANTNNTALAIGEKAADIFIKELRLR